MPPKRRMCEQKWVTTPSKQMSQFSRCERYCNPPFLENHLANARMQLFFLIVEAQEAQAV